MAENEPVLAEAIAEDVIAKKPRGLILRLDNGTVISNRDDITKGTDEVVCLRPEDAYEAGLLSEAHLLRAQALLCEVHAKLPEEGPLRSISTGSKRSADTAVQIGETFKRSEGCPPPIASAPTTTMDTATWGPLAKNIINKTCEAIGRDAHLFQNPVNAELVADYYNIIKSPICWNEIVKKLDAGEYPTPIEFYNDADLLFRNCFTYNPVGTPVYTLGVISENAFEKEWAKTPFSSMVPPKPRKRINAARGPRKPGGGGRGSFGNGGGGPMVGGGGSGRGRSAPPGPRRPPGRPPGVARTKSVNSYKAYQNLPPEKQAQLAQALQDESVLATKMNGVIQILRDANELGSNEEGEVELDLSKVSPSVVWALYEFIFGRGAAAAAPAPSMGPARSAGRLFTEDSDYDPMDEDDDE